MAPRNILIAVGVIVAFAVMMFHQQLLALVATPGSVIASTDEPAGLDKVLSKLDSMDKKIDHIDNKVEAYKAELDRVKNDVPDMVAKAMDAYLRAHGKMPGDMVVAEGRQAAAQLAKMGDDGSTPQPSAIDQKLDKVIALLEKSGCHQQVRVINHYRDRVRTRYVRVHDESVYADRGERYYGGDQGQADYLTRTQNQQASYTQSASTSYTQPPVGTLVPAAAPTGVITSGSSGGFGGLSLSGLSFGGGTRVTVQAPQAQAPAGRTTIVNNVQGASITGSGNSRITGSGNGTATAAGYGGQGGSSYAQGGAGGLGGQGGQGGRGGVGGGCTGTCAASTSAAAAVTGGAVATPTSVGTFYQGSTSGASSPSASSGGGHGGGRHHGK